MWMRILKRFTGLVVIGFGLFAMFTAVGKLSTPKETKPVSAPQSIGVGALGRLEPEWKVLKLAPPTAMEGGRVEQLLVQEGDSVAVAAIVAILDTQKRREAAVKEAEGQLAVAEAKLQQILAGAKKEEIAIQEAILERHKATLERTKREYDRANQLRGTRAMAIEDIDRRLSDYEAARHNVKEAEALLASIQVIRDVDIRFAEAEILRAKANVERAKADLEATLVRALISGTILKIHAREGERIGDDGIAEMGNTERMQAVAEVYEADVSRLRLGQPATVRVCSGSDLLKGTVVNIGSLVGRRVVLDNDPVKDTDARVVEVRIQLNPEAAQKVRGLSYARVEVAIDTQVAGASQ